MMQPHGPLLCFILLHISNSSVSASLVGYVLCSADLMSATYIPHSLLMVHRYIYSRYSPIFPTLYQLYHSLSSSTLISSSSLYLKLQSELLLKVVTRISKRTYYHTSRETVYSNLSSKSISKPLKNIAKVITKGGSEKESNYLGPLLLNLPELSLEP